MAGEGSDALPWTVDRVNTINRRWNERNRAAKAALEQLPKTIKEIQKQIAQLSKVPVNHVLYAAAQADLAAAQVNLGNPHSQT